MDYINSLLYFFRISSEIETKLIDEPESLYRVATEVPSAHNEKWNVRSSQVCSLRSENRGRPTPLFYKSKCVAEK